MGDKKIFIFICFIICLFSIAGVCASDVNQTTVASDEINQELSLYDADELSASITDENSDDSIEMSSEENDTLNLNYDDDVVSNTDSSLSNIYDISSEYGASGFINVTVNGATGITAKIDDEPAEVNGLTITIHPLSVGKHILSVTTIPDNNHNSITKTATITVNKAQSLKELDNYTLNYGNSSKISVSTEGAIKIIAQIDDENVAVNGNEISIQDLDAGIHTLTVTTVPDENHTASTKTATITVNKVDSLIGMGNLNLDYGSSSTINVTTVGVIKFTAKIDGKDVEVSGDMIIVPPLDVGSHNLTVTTVPDMNHNPVTRTSTITVNKYNPMANVKDITLGYGESYNIQLNNDGTTKFTAKIDGNIIAVVENQIVFPKLEVGNHTLTVSTVKDANHDSLTKTAKITVTKAKTILVTHDLNTTAGHKITLTTGMALVQLVSEGVVTFYDGETKIGQANVISGIAELDYTPSKSGIHKISAVYGGTSRFESSQSSFELTVYEKPKDTYVTNSSIVIIPSSDGFLNDPTAVVSLPSDATGTVTLTINGADYKSDMENGVARIRLPDLDDGVYPYRISYSGDSQYSPFKSNGTFNVTKGSDSNKSGDSKIPIKFPSTFGNIPGGSSIPIDLPDDATGTVTLIVNGNSYDFAVKDGKATVKMPNLGDGNYPFTIRYSGDDQYLSFARDGTLVKPASALGPVITAPDVRVVYSSGSYYTIKVTGTDGKPANGAIVKISGKISKTIAAKNGVAKFKVSQAPGTYKINITALGKSITRTITVKHLVTLKSVTVKKSAKKLVLQATLGKIKGKYLNKKTVTFKFNGKKYKAKTNAKGIAKYTLKSSVLKKLKVGKKITYQATYAKDTVKKTVKVKK